MKKEIDEIELEIENKRMNDANHHWIKREQDAVRARLLRRLMRHGVELKTSEIEVAAFRIFDGRIQHRMAEQRRAESLTLLESYLKWGRGSIRFPMAREIIRRKMRLNMKF